MKELEELVNKTRKGKDWCSISCKVDSATKKKIKEYAASKNMNLNRLLLTALLNEVNGDKKVTNKYKFAIKKLKETTEKHESLLKMHKTVVSIIKDKNLDSEFEPYFTFPD